MVNKLERFHLHNATRLDNQINDTDTVKYNVIFETII